MLKTLIFLFLSALVETIGKLRAAPSFSKGFSRLSKAERFVLLSAVYLLLTLGWYVGLACVA